MDIAAFASAYESLKAAKDIIRAAIEAKVDAEAKSKVINALEQLGNAQDALFGLREDLLNLQTENATLRQELADVQSWEARASQYQLARTAGGAVVYKFNGDPEHFACPSCFNRQQIHILQDCRVVSGRFRCTGCAADFLVNPYESSPPQVHTNDNPRSRI